MILDAWLLFIIALGLWITASLSTRNNYRSAKLSRSMLGAVIYLFLLIVLVEMQYAVSYHCGLILTIVWTVVINYGMLTRAAMNYIARKWEGNTNPDERYKTTGSMGFRYSNVVLTAMSGAGMYGLVAANITISVSQLLGAFALSAAMMWIIHRIDSKNYDPAKGSSDATPTKLYHDYMVQGVFWGIAIITWINFLLRCLITWTMLNLPAFLCIILGFVLLAIIGATGKKYQPLDYAKLHPATAVAQDSLIFDGELWDGKSWWRWFLSIAVVIVLYAICLCWQIG